MASGPITLWQMHGGNTETVTDFIFLGSKINVDGDCSHEIKKTLAPLKNSYDQPRWYIRKQRGTKESIDEGEKEREKLA